MEAVKVDDPDAALDDLGNILVTALQILLEAAPEQFGLASDQSPPDPLPRVGDWPRQRQTRHSRAVLIPDSLADVLILGLEQVIFSFIFIRSMSVKPFNKVKLWLMFSFLTVL